MQVYYELKLLQQIFDISLRYFDESHYTKVIIN
jgi:hypothetical protein